MKKVLIGIGLLLLLGLLFGFAISKNLIKGYTYDAKKVSDAKRLSIALELYYKDHLKFPEQLNELTPEYAGSIPEPSVQDGKSCQLNKYLYFSPMPYKTYRLSFCLDSETGSLVPGSHFISPSGFDKENLNP